MLTNLFIPSDSSGGTELLLLMGEIMIDYLIMVMVEVIAIFQSTLAFISVVVILIEL